VAEMTISRSFRYGKGRSEDVTISISGTVAECKQILKHVGESMKKEVSK